MESTLQHRSTGASVPIPTPTSPTQPMAATRPRASNKTQPKIWEKIVAVLVFVLLAVIFGYVFMLSTSHNEEINKNVYPPGDRSKYNAMRRYLEHGGDGNSNNVNNKDNKGKKSAEQQHSPIEINHNNDHLNYLADNVDDGVVVDAATLASVTDPHEAHSDNLWKLSCVGRPRDAESAQDGFCIMNAELIDRRDLHNAHGDSHAHEKRDDNNNDEQQQQHKKENPQQGISFREKLGKGIKRHHRPIPDDSLVQDHLHPKKISYKMVGGAGGGGGGGAGDDQKFATHVLEGPDQRTKMFVQGEAVENKGFDWQSPTHPTLSVSIESSLTGKQGTVVHDDHSDHTTTFKVAGGGDDVKFFGLGNRGSSIQIPEHKQITLKNLDINHYKLDSGTSLYGVVPLLYASVKLRNSAAEDANQNNNNSPAVVVTIGIFVLNGSPMQVEAHSGGTIRFYTLGGGIRIFVLPGPTPMAVLRQYFHLTGTPNLPPLFALGYHQSRWTYRDQSDVLSVHRGFLTAKLPCDVIWLDIDHTDDKRYFTWDSGKFPDPTSMQNDLFREAGRRLVTITDPHIKHDEHYHVFSQGRNGHHFVTHRDRRTFYGHCWPGESAWIDFLQEETRDWYASLFRYGSYHGSTPHLFSWIDMNEPSVFSGPDLTLPFADAAHFGGSVMHKDVHNTYGFYHSMATYRGLFERDLYAEKPSAQAKRPFVLTRSFFAGSHRYAAVWTGDNQGQWEHLTKSFDMTLMLSMGGVQLVGADIGGFFDSTEENLLASWYSAAVAYPFFRGHSHQDTARREPWLIEREFGRVKRAMAMRYRVIPYLYTCFAHAHIFGEPVMRPLWFAFPEALLHSETSPTASNSAEFFFWGNALMWRPFVKRDELVDENARKQNVDLCSGDAAAKDIWLSSGSGGGNGNNNDKRSAVPNFVSWCSMQWVNPDADARTCSVSPSTCETPIFQRASTVVVVGAYPSVKYSVNGFREGEDNNANNNANAASATSNVPFPYPQSTRDLLQQRPAAEKSSASSSSQQPQLLEARIAFSLDMDSRSGDILAYGTHFVDDGESDFSIKHGTRYCLLQWALRTSDDDAKSMTLCAMPHPEQQGTLPPFHAATCHVEMNRIRRFVFLAHAPDKGHQLAQLKIAKVMMHGGSDEVQSKTLLKTDEGSESLTFVLEFSNSKEGGGAFRMLQPGEQWCVKLMG